MEYEREYGEDGKDKLQWNDYERKRTREWTNDKMVEKGSEMREKKCRYLEKLKGRLSSIY